MDEGQIFSRQAVGEMKRSYNRVQSLPRLALLSRNAESDSVARDAFILGVFIAVVVEIVFVNAGSTLSGVVSEAEKDTEMAESADIND